MALFLTAGAATAQQDRSARGAREGSVTMMERRFLTAAALGQMMEIDLGRLAQQKGSRDEVKSFGARMVRDHEKGLQEVNSLARSRGISLPAGMSMPGERAAIGNDRSRSEGGRQNVAAPTEMPELAELGLRHEAIHHQEERQLLSGLSGRAFDEAYLGGQVQDHAKMAAMLEAKPRMTQDTGIRDWAAKALPVVKEHLQMARRLAGLRGESRDR
jgi:putative membrane protein